MMYGADYYPEHWPKERWMIDAKMMQEAHINVVRMGEFAWHRFEPTRGQYDFTWLDEAIELLATYGIRTIIGTPTATPPKWMMDEYPEIYPVDVYGLKKGFGTRRHYCVNNRQYQLETKVLVEKMVNHYKNNPHIIAWQIDNEFDAGCYCESCEKTFRDWLKEKYGLISEVNKSWGTVFWSQSYNDFDEVISPKYSSSDGFSQNGEGSGLTDAPKNQNPGLLLDYARFQSDSVVKYQDLQINIIREQSTLPITHNYMGHFSQLDYFNLGKNLDVISWDCYPNMMWGKSDYKKVAMAHDLMRGIKNQNFWMMEQQSGPCGWQAMGDTPEPGQIRLWTYQAIGHGAEAMLYFRWRPALFGTEQYWHGILDHDGVGRRRYKEISQIGSELNNLSKYLVGLKSKSEVCLIKSYDNVWSHEVQPHNAKFNYNDLLYDYYSAFHKKGVAIDVTSVEVEFSNYPVVLMPAFNLCSDEIIQKCRTYVNQGGHLVITFRSGTRHMNNQLTEMTLPGYFGELAGIELKEYDSVSFGRTVEVIGDHMNGVATMWCDIIVSKETKVLARYASHYYEGEAAITCHDYNQGKVYYIGCDLDESSMATLADEILKKANVNPLTEPIAGVEVIQKESAEGGYYILLNHNNNDVTVDMRKESKDLMTGIQYDRTITLKPYDVKVVLI